MEELIHAVKLPNGETIAPIDPYQILIENALKTLELWRTAESDFEDVVLKAIKTYSNVSRPGE